MNSLQRGGQYVAVALIAFLFYFSFMPETVQGLDTGELVTNSHLLRVSHPPGYPLFSWLYYLFTNIAPFKNIFWSASLLTVLLSIGTLLLLYGAMRGLPQVLRFLFVLSIATGGLFWKYSLLPDVFMLHVFIASLILYLYIEKRKDFLKGDSKLLLLFLWGLSTGNHHSTIFLLPVIIHALWEEGKRRGKEELYRSFSCPFPWALLKFSSLLLPFLL